MTAVEPKGNEEQRKTPALQTVRKKVRSRKKDSGPEVLAHMEQFVSLVRKVKRPALILALVERANTTPLDGLAERVPLRVIDGALPLTSRNALFTLVAALQAPVQALIERAAERVILLGDDYGYLAVSDLLDAHELDDAAMLADGTDRYSRALYLYLKQEFPTGAAVGERRFDHAEARQGLLRHACSERYSSHFLGPKGIAPWLDEAAETLLRQRLAVIFPQVAPGEMLIEKFERRDPEQPGQSSTLFTLNVTFNGSRIHFQQVADGEVVDYDEPAVTPVQFAWQSAKGTLCVYCEDQDVRPELAAIFRDVVLGGQADIHSMPMWEFDLLGFAAPAMLERIKNDRVDGIESISIQNIRVAKPEIRQTVVRGKPVRRHVANALVIRRHRHEDRDIYEMAKHVLRIGDLRDYSVQQVSLSVRIAKSPHRKAHNVSAQVTAPNGFNDRSKTKEDSELIYRQLARWGCARQY